METSRTLPLDIIPLFSQGREGEAGSSVTHRRGAAGSNGLLAGVEQLREWPPQ
jgi:hypothetical protein